MTEVERSARRAIMRVAGSTHEYMAAAWRTEPITRAERTRRVEKAAEVIRHAAQYVAESVRSEIQTEMHELGLWRLRSGRARSRWTAPAESKCAWVLRKCLEAVARDALDLEHEREYRIHVGLRSIFTFTGTGRLRL